MTDKERYLYTQEHIILLARASLTLDMDWFWEQLNGVEAFGPILSPELHRETCGTIAKVRKIAEAVRAFQRVAREVAMDG